MAKNTDFKPFRPIFRIFNVVSAQNTQNSPENYTCWKAIKIFTFQLVNFQKFQARKNDGAHLIIWRYEKNHICKGPFGFYGSKQFCIFVESYHFKGCIIHFWNGNDVSHKNDNKKCLSPEVSIKIFFWPHSQWTTTKRSAAYLFFEIGYSCRANGIHWENVVLAFQPYIFLNE